METRLRIQLCQAHWLENEKIEFMLQFWLVKMLVNDLLAKPFSETCLSAIMLISWTLRWISIKFCPSTIIPISHQNPKILKLFSKLFNIIHNFKFLSLFLLKLVFMCVCVVGGERPPSISFSAKVQILQN